MEPPFQLRSATFRDREGGKYRFEESDMTMRRRTRLGFVVCTSGCQGEAQGGALRSRLYSSGLNEPGRCGFRVIFSKNTASIYPISAQRCGSYGTLRPTL
jgi:hypothetical protein